MVNVLILAAPGINRDEATKLAIEKTGANGNIVHITQLIKNPDSLHKYQVMIIPGGFSHGDHIQSGRLLALEFLQHKKLRNAIESYLKKGKFLLGVCNGFQVLVQCGLLPFGRFHPISENTVTLTWNLPKRFQSRWIFLKTLPSKCVFIKSGEPVTFPIAHSEGRFLAMNKKIIQQLFRNKQVVYQYCTRDGVATMKYPDNPTSSTEAIAGICDPSGQILGMMPHAEDFIRREHHPNWRRMNNDFPIDGLDFFRNIVESL